MSCVHTKLGTYAMRIYAASALNLRLCGHFRLNFPGLTISGPLTYVRLARCKTPLGEMVGRILPAYNELFQALAKLGVPEVQMHEPALVLSDGDQLKGIGENVYGALSANGVPINLVVYYDDVGASYPWVVSLPVATISLDFLGVPGAAVTSQTMELVKKYGFPANKRLGAGM